MTISTSQFDSKLKNQSRTPETDARYVIPYPAEATDWRTFNFTNWLRALSSEANGENFTGATFDGENVYLLANKTHFDAEIATATGVEISDVVSPPVTPVVPVISYSISTFNEAAANDGSITATATITLVGDTFTGTNGQPLTGAVVTNVPTGLTAVVTKTSNTTATLSFTGNATNHEAVNSITNLTVTLGNTAFTGGNASGVTNATKSDLGITFINAPPVTPVTPTISYSATTFNEAAINNGSIIETATITLTNDTFTGTNGQPLAGAVVTNVPAGLTAVVTKVSDTTAELSFTGMATANNAADSITNLTVTLGNAAFTSGNAAAVTDATKNNLVITFID